MKLLLVNGFYASTKNFFTKNYIGLKGKRGYWTNAFISRAADYFQVNEEDIVFVDGCCHYSSGGKERFKKGYDQGYVLNDQLKDGHPVSILSHSQGAAYAEGISNNFMKQGREVKKTVHLAASDGQQFQSQPDIFTIQLDYSYDPVLLIKSGYAVLENVNIYGRIKEGSPFNWKTWRNSHKKTKYDPEVFDALETMEGKRKKSYIFARYIKR